MQAQLDAQQATIAELRVALAAVRERLAAFEVNQARQR
jgi:hypothetical protein